MLGPRRLKSSSWDATRAMWKSGPENPQGDGPEGIAFGFEFELLSAFRAEKIPHRGVVGISIYGCPPAVGAVDLRLDPGFREHPRALGRAAIRSAEGFIETQIQEHPR